MGIYMMKNKLILMIILLSSLYADLPNKNNIELFPPAENGYQRYIVEVPHKGEENIYKLELQIGKVLYMDCNEYRFDGKVEIKALDNSNKTYLVVSNIGKTKALTGKKCKEKRKDKFVFLSISDKLWKKYDSSTPQVIYVPKEYEVRFRIWEAEKYRQKAVNR